MKSKGTVTLCERCRRHALLFFKPRCSKRQSLAAAEVVLKEGWKEAVSPEKEIVWASQSRLCATGFQ